MTSTDKSIRYSWPVLLVGAALLVVSSGSCFDPYYSDNIPCSEQSTCPPEMTCDRDFVCRRVPIDIRCGDGIVDSDRGEVCDDSNNSAGDGCSADCKSDETCGNGIVDVVMGEVCDDGNSNPADSCRNDCAGGPGCGNGLPDLFEPCDDGNTDNNDDCVIVDNVCRLAECGDGFVHEHGSGTEACDGDGAGNPGQTAGCDLDCTPPACGDGVHNDQYINPLTNMAEQCDSGGSNSATCDTDCTIATCGDGFHNDQFVNPLTDMAEQCDGGGNSPSCDADCTEARCGDGFLNPVFEPTTGNPEQCDDGNTASGDGCSDECQIEHCGDGIVQVSLGEECDEDANSDDIADNTASCDNNCTRVACGDNLHNPAAQTAAGGTELEQCDVDSDGDGVADNDATCDRDCTAPECGDGHVNDAFDPDDDGPATAEQCEPPNSMTCSAACQTLP
ncbi:MAG: DUF4215 domain-containing protein [Proteobacteria bacterium]|nr:DUF4215 domain-containing protein [Pseudomonadota bacterium]